MTRLRDLCATQSLKMGLVDHSCLLGLVTQEVYLLVFDEARNNLNLLTVLSLVFLGNINGIERSRARQRVRIKMDFIQLDSFCHFVQLYGRLCFLAAYYGVQVWIKRWRTWKGWSFYIFTHLVHHWIILLVLSSRRFSVLSIPDMLYTCSLLTSRMV